MNITFHGMTAETATAFRNGAPDSYGNAVETQISDGAGTPCRHCLRDVPRGAAMLVLAYRPFTTLQPYAETGPIFLCASDCTPGPASDIPWVLTTSDTYLIKGYTADERILYGTGDVVPASRILPEITDRLHRPDIAFVDIRSARNNCWIARARRS